MRLNRRSFLGLLGGAGAAAVVGVPLLSGLRGSKSTGELLSSRCCPCHSRSCCRSVYRNG